MQKAIISAVIYVLAVLIIFYPALSFAAWTFNPANWNHLERFTIALPVVLVIMVAFTGDYKKAYDKFKLG